MKINFPKPNEKEQEKYNPLMQLNNFCEEFNKTYLGHFFGVIITSSDLIDNNTSIINYAFWINFINANNYSYRFFEVTPNNPQGGYPVNVVAFHGPPLDIGQAKTADELEELIGQIFDSERGKFIILSNY